jgi:hypothetical protein
MTRGVVAAFLAFVLVSSTWARGSAAPTRQKELQKLATALDLTDRGVGKWLDRLGVIAGNADSERLIAVTVTGELLFERQGDASSVRVDPELDGRLGDRDQPVVLVHNHPANAGLSAADLRLLTRRGLAAIVAIGHDGSVFAASAGPLFDRDFFEEHQYAVAYGEVQKRLRYDVGPRISGTVSAAHSLHLVTLVLSDAGVLYYWFDLRGAGRLSYDESRFTFANLVAAASKPLKVQLKTVSR